MDKETYDSLPLTRWLDKSVKPIRDHPEIPTELQKTPILKRQSGVPVEILLVKSYDLGQDETGKATVGQDLMNLLQKLADNKSVDSTRRYDDPEFTKKRRKGVGLSHNNLLNAGDPENKEVVRTLVEKIPEQILKQTKPRRKRVSFKE